MRLDERPFAIRTFAGVDRASNARVRQPGSWYILKDLWMPDPGDPEQRPGSVEFASTVTLGEPSYRDKWPVAPDEFDIPYSYEVLDPTVIDADKFIRGTRIPTLPIGRTTGQNTTVNYGQVVPSSDIFRGGF